MKLKIILFILLFPSLCGASISMNPAKADFISEDKVFKAGNIYRIDNFRVGNTDEVARRFKVSVECEHDKNCLPVKDWIVVSPAEFILQPHQTQLIEAELKIPRDIDPKLYDDYQFLLAATAVPNEGTGMSYGLAVASIVSFKLAGKTPMSAVIKNWFNRNVGNKVSASLTGIGIDPKTTAFVSLFLVGIYALGFGTKKVISKFARDKVKN